MADTAAADDVLQTSVQRARNLLADAPGKRVLRMLEQADSDLKKRLGPMGKVEPGMRFTDAQAMAYQKQISVSIRYVKERLKGLTDKRATMAIRSTVRSTASELGRLDRLFTGVTTPLRLREAATMAGITKRVVQSRIGMSETSVDRYGAGMEASFRTIMRKGMVAGVSQSQMVDALVGHGGPRGPRVSVAARVDPATRKVIRLREEAIPEGLFTRKRYWAERVVRTEVAHSQNEARLQTITRSKETDFPDMGKKIMAMMDMRTAMDSIGVHGQVRPTDGLFMDGAGRQYLRPPARPNDRETIVPWRLAWEETAYTAPMPPAEVAQLQQAKMAPGKAKQAAVAAARASEQAALDKSAKAAMANIRRMIGQKLGGETGPAIAAQAVTATKAMQGTAMAQRQAAAARARTSRARADAKAAAQAQKYVTAAGTAQARVSQARKRMRAKVEEQQKKVRALARAKLLRDGLEARRRISKLTPVKAADALARLAVADPPVFGEVFRQTVKDGGDLAPRFFQTLAKTYRTDARKIVDAMGK